MHFDVAPLDDYAARITTGAAFVGGVLLLPLFFAILSNTRWYGLFIPAGFALAIAIFLSFAYGGQPTAYTIEETQLRISRRWLRSLKVPLLDIEGVSSAPMLADVSRAGMRFAFNAGIFGYQGPLELESYGRVFFLATNCERLIAVVRPAALPLIISPARPRAFLDRLNEQRLKAQENVMLDPNL